MKVYHYTVETVDATNPELLEDTLHDLQIDGYEVAQVVYVGPDEDAEGDDNYEWIVIGKQPLGSDKKGIEKLKAILDDQNDDGDERAE